MIRVCTFRNMLIILFSNLMLSCLSFKQLITDQSHQSLKTIEKTGVKLVHASANDNFHIDIF